VSSGRGKPDPRVAEINRKLQLIMDHLQITDPGPQASASVLGELQQGRTIQAIKLYREETGTGLAEAKNAVEEIARRHGL
jgi:ribosomal protein L7/L12